MTSPARQLIVACPCGHTYADWWRPSINLEIEDWTDDEIAEATSTRYPVCGRVRPLP
jgi:hypothetical protein